MISIYVNVKNKKDASKYIFNYYLNNVWDKILEKIACKYEAANALEFKAYIEEKISNYCNREEYLYSIIKDNLYEYDYVDIDGFIRFRLNGFYNYINTISSEIHSDYLSLKKYDKMISLIKVIIKNNDPIVFHLHIEINKKSFFELYDDYCNDITEICLKEFIEEYKEYNLTKNDFILSTLLSLTPRVVTIHHAERIKNKDFLNTLKKIYEENLIIS